MSVTTSAPTLVQPKRRINQRLLSLAITIGVGTVLWFLPIPEGLTTQCWHLLAIFCSIITGLILKPFPVAPTCLFGAVIALLTKLITFEATFAAVSSESIWLIVFATFMARGLIKTGLAVRLSYFFIRVFGKTTLGLSYSLLGGELLVAPFTPSIVARSGGIVYPIILSILQNSRKDGKSYTSDEMGRFLILSVFQGSLGTSAMFLTAMAANPICQQIALSLDISLTWGTWALAASVPGLLSLLIVPYLVYRLFPPSVKKSPEAPELARTKLKEMSSLKSQELVMLFSFILVLFLWIFGPLWGISSVMAPMCGLAILFLTNILSWNDCLEQHSAWNTLFWLSILIGFGMQLKNLGLFSWLSSQMIHVSGGLPLMVAFGLIILSYFYSHYLLASNTVHITSMYSAFLLASINIGIPPLYAALMLGFLSSLFGGITHYGNTAAPIYYGSQQVKIKQWWGVGGVVSVVNLFIWVGIGSLWCYSLGIL